MFGLLAPLVLYTSRIDASGDNMISEHKGKSLFECVFLLSAFLCPILYVLHGIVALTEG